MLNPSKPKKVFTNNYCLLQNVFSLKTGPLTPAAAMAVNLNLFEGWLDGPQ